MCGNNDAVDVDFRYFDKIYFGENIEIVFHVYLWESFENGEQTLNSNFFNYAI